MAFYYPTEDTNLNIARGLVKGTSVRNIFGYNDTVPTDTFVPAWELSEEYVYPTQNTAVDIVSLSNNDTEVSILISGLDSNYEPVEEVINLSGTTAVTSNTEFLVINLSGTTAVTSNTEFFRINDVITVSGNAEGNVSVTDTSNTNITYAKIRAGDGKNQASIYTVPAGHSLYLSRINVYCSSGTSPKESEFRNLTISSSGRIIRAGQTRFLQEMTIQRTVPFRYEEKTDIQLQVKSYNTEHFSGVFAEAILIKDGLA
jgi:hypothetical protein